MKIYSMGDGLFDGAEKDLDGRPCLVLLADSREELADALTGIGLRDPVTIVLKAGRSARVQSEERGPK